MSITDLVRRALKAAPRSNEELRAFVAEHGYPSVGSDTISSVLNGIRRRGEIKKQDGDLRWVLAPPAPDPSGDELPGVGISHDLEA
ncbi:MAG: hypothetical protein ACE15B_19550 [Bryobacteraceae bacterium]